MTAHIETPQEEHVVHEFFLVSILIKGFISVAEVVVGVAILFIPPELIVRMTLFFLEYVPHASLQNALMLEVSHYTSSSVLFVFFYLFSRGLIKALLILGLLLGKLIAYPLSLAVMIILVFYQLYQLIFMPFSLIILGITLFDLVVMYFIYREWRIVMRHRGRSWKLPFRTSASQ